MDQEQISIKLTQAKQDLDFIEKKIIMADTEENKTRWENLKTLKLADILRLKKLKLG